jgi:hypothetical protein
MESTPNAEFQDSGSMLMSVSVKDLEQDFLFARQRRTESKKAKSQQQRRSQADELYTFWSGLRTKLSRWKERLEALKQDTTNGAADTDFRQQFEDLKQELHLLRKRCLTNCALCPGAGPGPDAGALWTTNEEQWRVPDFLPVADLRLLHAEFTKHFQELELAKQALIPQEKFAFTKYRQELARRKSLGLSLTNSSSPSSDSDSEKRQSKAKSQAQAQAQAKQPSHDFITGAYLQDLSNKSIHVARNGKVMSMSMSMSMSANENDNDNDDHTSICTDTDTHTITAETLFLRNLHNCTIRM